MTTDELILKLNLAYSRAVYIEEQEIGELMREAADAIAELQQIAGHYEECAKDYFKDVCYYKERVPKWIPVTERLPKYGDWVLGIGPKKGYHICEYRGIMHFLYSGDSPWFSAKGRSLTITHWMPLPEPPKEDE